MAMRSEPLLDTHTIRGIREFFQRAGNRPAVVSLSLGGHIGAHDGTSAIENVVARESGPGRIVVVAAGNEGGDSIHWKGELHENNEITIPVRIADPNLQVVDVWIPRGDEVQIQIQPPDGTLSDPDGEVHSTVFGDFLADWREDAVNRDQNLTLLVAGSVNFTWHIRITAVRVLHGEVHAWGHTSSPSNANSLFPGFMDPGFSIGMPGTEERAIVVGSFVSKKQFDTKDGILVAETLNVGQLSPFSSRGPTRIGKQKPDIAAPGQYITAALANNSHFTDSPTYTPRHHPTAGYITIQGTSMATPFVAGVIALMLEREPELTPEEIQQRLRITARRDDDTGRVWDSGFGYGKIDVEALLNYTA
jgi:subtilisin family serine protease